MANTLDLVLRILGKDASGSAVLQKVAREADRTEKAIEEVGDAADKTQQKVTRIGSGGGMARFASDVERANASVRRMDDAMEDAGKKVENLRDAGRKIGAIGAGGLLLASHLKKVSEEGRNLEARLESLLRAQGRFNDLGQFNNTINNIATRGHLPDDDPVREAAIQMASDQVATADLANLLEAAARNAETLKQPIDAVGEAFAKAYAEGQLTRLKRMNILFSDQEEEAVKAAFAISEVAGRAKFMEVVMASTARSTGELGTGLTESQKAANDAARALDDAMTNMGAGAANADAKIKTLAGSVLQLGNNSKESQEGAGALLQYGSYAATAAFSVIELATAVAQAIFAKRLLTVAQADAAKTATANAVAQGAQAAAITASGNAAAVAAPKIGLLARAQGLFSKLGGLAAANPGVAGLAAGGVGYSALAHSGALGENRPGTFEAVGNVARRLRYFGQYHQTDEGRIPMWEAVERGNQAEAYSKGLFAKLRQKSLARRAAANTVASPAMPGAAALGGGIASEGAASSTGVAGADYTAQIRSLEDQIAATKDKTAKDRLNAQLKRLRRAQQDAKKAEREQKKEDKEAREQQETREMIRAATLENRNSEVIATLETGAQITEARNRALMEAELERIEAMQESGKMERKAAERATKRIRAAYERKTDLLQAETEFKLRQIEAEEVMQKARIEAENEADSVKERALNLASLASKKILAVAKIRLNAAQELVRIADREGGDGIGGNGWGKRARVAYGTGQAGLQGRIQEILDAASRERDPAMQSYMMRRAGVIADSIAPDGGNGGGRGGGRRITIGMPEGRVTMNTAGEWVLEFEKPKPIVFPSRSLTGGF